MDAKDYITSEDGSKLQDFLAKYVSKPSSKKLFEIVCQDYIELSSLIQKELNIDNEVEAMLSAWQ